MTTIDLVKVAHLTVDYVAFHVLRILVADIDNDFPFTRNVVFIFFGHRPFSAVIPFDERRNHRCAPRDGKFNCRIQILDVQRYTMHENSVDRQNEI